MGRMANWPAPHVDRLRERLMEELTIEAKGANNYNDISPGRSSKENQRFPRADVNSLKGRRPNERIDVVVIVQNRTKETFSFEQVAPGANVRRQRYRRRRWSRQFQPSASFRSRPRAPLRHPKDHYSVDIECSGAIRRMTLGFQVEWAGVVSFDRS